MFCIKCGNQLADGARFCPKCGFEVDAAPVSQGAPGQTGQASAYQNAGPSQGQSNFASSASSAVSSIPREIAGVSIFSIVAIAVSAIALIFAFLPWLESSYGLQSLGVISSYGSALTGKSYASFADSYSVIGFFGLAGALGSYGVGGYVFLLDIVALLWIVAVLATIAGVVVMFVTSNHLNIVFLAGNGALALVSIIWFLLYGVFVSQDVAIGIPGNAIVCFFLSAIALALNVIALVKPDLLDSI